MDALWLDLRWSVRTLAKRPLASLAVVAILASAIAVATVLGTPADTNRDARATVNARVLDQEATAEGVQRVALTSELPLPGPSTPITASSSSGSSECRMSLDTGVAGVQFYGSCFSVHSESLISASYSSAEIDRLA